MTQRIELESITLDVALCWGTVYHNLDDPKNIRLAMDMLGSIPRIDSNYLINIGVNRWNNDTCEILANSPTTELKATSLRDAMARAKFEEEMFDVD